jgi:hypothetical protein
VKRCPHLDDLGGHALPANSGDQPNDQAETPPADTHHAHGVEDADTSLPPANEADCRLTQAEAAASDLPDGDHSCRLLTDCDEAGRLLTDRDEPLGLAAHGHELHAGGLPYTPSVLRCTLGCRCKREFRRHIRAGPKFMLTRSLAWRS